MSSTKPTGSCPHDTPLGAVCEQCWVEQMRTQKKHAAKLKRLGDSMALDLTDTHSKKQWRKYTEK